MSTKTSICKVNVTKEKEQRKKPQHRLENKTAFYLIFHFFNYQDTLFIIICKTIIYSNVLYLSDKKQRVLDIQHG